MMALNNLSNDGAGEYSEQRDYEDKGGFHAVEGKLPFRKQDVGKRAAKTTLDRDHKFCPSLRAEVLIDLELYQMVVMIGPRSGRFFFFCHWPKAK